VRAREARTVFNSYDRNRSGALEVEELQSCLEDLGILVRTQEFSEFRVLARSNLAGSCSRASRTWAAWWVGRVQSWRT
jgi:Ca2+-binding EF-hand superfamily protein